MINRRLNFDLSVCLEQTNQRPLCVKGAPPKAVGDCFSLYYQSLRHFVTPPFTQGRLIFNFHKLLDKSQFIVLSRITKRRENLAVLLLIFRFCAFFNHCVKLRKGIGESADSVNQSADRCFLAVKHRADVRCEHIGTHHHSVYHVCRRL